MNQSTNQPINQPITVEQASEIILQNALDLPAEAVPFAAALGRVLREDLCADRDFPPFDRVTMDGIAVRFSAFEAGRHSFRIAGMAAAGAPQTVLGHAENCIEVMTGAMLPNGADTVVRYEDLHLENGVATIQIEAVTQFQNIHNQGIDRRAGDLLVPAGRRIGPAEIGTAATVGKEKLMVSRPPRTAIVATGDELVAVGAEPLPHQIRASNVFSVQALLAELGVAGRVFHFPDDEKTLREGLAKVLAEHELVVISGAVSAGKFDFVPTVLADLGVEKLFHAVAQRPGKPFWFGRQPGAAGARVFALPGNPVSTFLCTVRFVLPWLRRSLGMAAAPPEFAVLVNDLVFKPDLTYFVPVKLENRGGQLLAHTLAGHGSGDLANLNDADAFLEIPRGREQFRAGEVFGLWRFSHR